MADSQPTENWRPVVGYEGLYEVSDHGRVRSVDGTRWNGISHHSFRGRVLSTPLVNGYPKAGLWRDNKEMQEYVHRLVLKTFVGPCPHGMQACHSNGDPVDARLTNLRWDTQTNNERDKIGHGTYFNRPRRRLGEAGPNVKLTNEKVDEIHSMHADGVPQRVIARRIGTSPSNVWRILHGKTWMHLHPNEVGQRGD